tara:strand:- start:419 stop:1384 length:966 start_codon:yes stop_codon:yes gene_type:complete
MNIKYILIVLGEPYSTFSEIIGKYFIKEKTFKEKIILIGNINLLNKQLKKLNYFLKLNEIKNLNEAKNNTINIINVKFNDKKVFSNISSKSNIYIKEAFDTSLKILKNKHKECILINGPISKKTFLNKKYLGMTEYLAKKTKVNNEIMLIYNEQLSVSPLTTHIPIKHVSNKISKQKIKKNIEKINYFYEKIFKKKVKIAVLGLNPHCETTDKFSEEEKIISPAIKSLKNKGLNIKGPFSADTFFLRENIKKYDVVIGMYHDQVLTPLKTLYNFNAINITLGLPFIRISPDHGPNSNMLGKNKSDPSSFFYAMNFIKRINS